MKAKEYFEKYEERLHPADETALNKAAYSLLLEMVDESQNVLKSRNAKSTQALLGVLKEFNDKWNAVVAMDTKKCGFSNLRYNGFKLFWLNKLPELKYLWK